MRHEPPKGFKSPEKPPRSLLDQIGPKHGLGPVAASSDRLQELADLYEQWVAVYRFADERMSDANKAGDAKAAEEADIVITHAVRRQKELISEICEHPARTITDLGRKARVFREHARDLWAEGEEPLARSLTNDVLALAEMAAPSIPDFTPAEMLESIRPADPAPVAP